MARRARRYGSVKDLPKIRDHLVRVKTEIDAQLDRAANGYPLNDRIAAMNEAELWWVSWEMTMYAAEAAASVPLGDPVHARPAPVGVILFERGTGFECPDVRDSAKAARGLYGQRLAVTYPTCGLYWYGTPTGLEVGVLGVRADEGSEVTLLDRFTAYPTGVLADDRFQPIWQLLMATWLLSSQSSITTRSRRPLDSAMPPGLGMPPGEVTVLHLRQRIIDEHAGHAAADGNGRNYSHRWWVRGHWRDARVGKGRRETRPTWVIPHVKGPADKPLAEKDQVVAWTRR